MRRRRLTACSTTVVILRARAIAPSIAHAVGALFRSRSQRLASRSGRRRRLRCGDTRRTNRTVRVRGIEVFLPTNIDQAPPIRRNNSSISFALFERIVSKHYTQIVARIRSLRQQ